MCCVELTSKGVLCTRLGSKGRADYIGLLVLFLLDGFAILMRPDKAETAVHGCPARVIWLCAYVRYWPDRGLVSECVTCFNCLIYCTWLWRVSSYDSERSNNELSKAGLPSSFSPRAFSSPEVPCLLVTPNLSDFSERKNVIGMGEFAEFQAH